VDSPQHTTTIGQRSQRFGKSRVAVLVLVIGALLSAGLFLVVRSWEHRQLETDFQRGAQDRCSAVRKEMDSHLLVVKSLGAFFGSSGSLEAGDVEALRRQFRDYASPLLSYHPGIQALEWIPRVPDWQRQTYEAAARRSGLADFQFTERTRQGKLVPAAWRHEYFPVYLVEPLGGNEAALGFDLASDPTRLEALQQARDTARPRATARITLVQETGNQFGLLVFMPVYKLAAPAGAAGQQRRELLGFALGVFRVGDVFASAVKPLKPLGVDMKLLDLSAQPGSRFLHFHPSRLRQSPTAPIDFEQLQPKSKLYHREVLDVAGRKWLILCTPTEHFLAARRNWQSWTALVVGLALTGMLASYLLTTAGQAQRVQDLATRLSTANRILNNEVIERKEAELQLKRAKKALERANATLEQHVAERTSELKEANQQLRQAQSELVQSEKMSMLGQLVAGVAHEVNTPTGAILNVCVDTTDHLRRLVSLIMTLSELPSQTQQWLEKTAVAAMSIQEVGGEPAASSRRRQVEERLKDAGVMRPRRMAEVIAACGLGPEAVNGQLIEHLSHGPVIELLELLLALRTSAEISGASARKIARIVRALRLYSRAGTGELIDIDVNETIDSTLVILHNRIKHVAEVKTRLQEALPPVKSGPELSQVWTNILNNACDAIEETHSQQPGLIEIVSRLDGGRVVVEISDNGPPIPEENLEKIFGASYTSKPVGKGTGLGLSICKSILDRCGGTIAARNEPGRVVFEVSLPVAEGKMPAAGPAQQWPVQQTTSSQS